MVKQLIEIILIIGVASSGIAVQGTVPLDSTPIIVENETQNVTRIDGKEYCYTDGRIVVFNKPFTKENFESTSHIQISFDVYDNGTCSVNVEGRNKQLMYKTYLPLIRTQRGTPILNIFYVNVDGSGYPIAEYNNIIRALNYWQRKDETLELVLAEYDIDVSIDRPWDFWKEYYREDEYNIFILNTHTSIFNGTDWPQAPGFNVQTGPKVVLISKLRNNSYPLNTDALIAHEFGHMFYSLPDAPNCRNDIMSRASDIQVAFNLDILGECTERNFQNVLYRKSN